MEIITEAKFLRRRGEWDPVQSRRFFPGADGRQNAWTMPVPGTF